DPGDFEALVVTRLERLGKQNRRLKYVGAVLLIQVLVPILVGVLWLGPWGKFLKRLHTVEAGGFVLLDEDGRRRAGRGAAPNGAGFNLYDRNDKLRASLYENTGGGVFLFLFDDQQDQDLVSLAASKDGSVLTFHDANGKKRAELTATKKDLGLRLFDENG